MEGRMINIFAVLFWIAAATLPLLVWGSYVAVKRQASLRSIFILIAAESVVLATLAAIAL
jgi:hypothetical protein